MDVVDPANAGPKKLPLALNGKHQTAPPSGSELVEVASPPISAPNSSVPVIKPLRQRLGKRSLRLSVFRKKVANEACSSQNDKSGARRTSSLGTNVKQGLSLFPRNPSPHLSDDCVHDNDLDEYALEEVLESPSGSKRGCNEAESPRVPAPKSRLCCSFRQSKSSKKRPVEAALSTATTTTTATNSHNAQLPCTLLTPEYGASIGANNSVSSCGGIGKLSLPESAIMPTNSAIEQHLLSAVQPSSLPTRLRKLSKAFFNSQNGDKIDLMNDWEIGGTQNPWVCPSDRHLQLRAQLKSGWSVRTASARSPTNTKQNAGGITDAEQEQIRKVLARAEAGRLNEQQRIGKMVDRLEKMRSRATGNGVTQCLLCQTEFGLLASKSYAAMCTDCRKYVCQKNCGIETYDQKRGEPIFLCKICSEYREVMWKKSGAWFYKEMPAYVKPTTNGTTPTGNGPSGSQRSFWQHHSGSRPNLSSLSPTTAFSTFSLQDIGTNKQPAQSMLSNGLSQNSGSDNVSSLAGSLPRVSRQLPIPPDQQQRLKTTPRPRITPSWVHEKVQSSMSIGSEDEESSSSSIDHGDFKQVLPTTTAASLARRHHHFHRSKETNGGRYGEGTTSVPSTSHQRVNLLGNRNPITDTEDSENDESRHTTPSTSPRHSLATPSSYGGDDLSQNHVSLVANEASDAKSIDSGVVQSDHSAQQTQMYQSGNLTIASRAGAASPSSTIHPGIPMSTSRSSQGEPMGKSPSHFGATPPPIPPRTHTASPSQAIERSISSASSSTASSSAMFHHPSSYFSTVHREPQFSHKNAQLSRESLQSLSTQNVESRNRSDGARSAETTAMTSSIVSEVDNALCGKSLAPGATEPYTKIEESTSPTFMSSPEDDSSTLGSIQFNLTYLHEDKQLIIHLIRAKNLKAMDKNGFSDPYVKFHIIPGNNKATKLTSKTIEKTLNPEWHEELIYYGITEDDRLRKTLRITVLDRDRIGSDFLGETRVALKKLPLSQMKKFNLYLEHAMPTPMEKPDEIERGKILMSICYNIQQGSLFVHIKRCAELLGMDSTGFSDPYCKVSLTPLAVKAHRQKTAMKKRTLNPEFNEILQFIVPFKDLPKKTLEIGVYDHDVGRHDDYIGGIVLSTAAKAERGQQWTQCIENPGKTFESWHKLDANN